MHCVRQIGGADPAGAGTREWGPFLPLTLTPKSMQVAPTGELATMSFNIFYSLDYLTTCSLTWVNETEWNQLLTGANMASSYTRIVCFREASLYWFELWRMLVLWHHKTGDIFLLLQNINSLACGWRSVAFSSSVIRQRDSSKVMNVIKNVVEAVCPRFVVNKQIDVFSIQNWYIKHKNTN